MHNDDTQPKRSKVLLRPVSLQANAIGRYSLDFAFAGKDRVVVAAVDVHDTQAREGIVDKPPFVCDVAGVQDKFEVRLFNDSHDLLARGNAPLFGEYSQATRDPAARPWCTQLIYP